MSRSYPLFVLALLVASAFVVVSSFAFGSSTLAAIAFGVSIGTGVVALAAAATAPTRAATALNAGVSLVSAWTILVSVGLFTGATQTWLLFAGHAAIAAAALAATAAVELRAASGEAREPVDLTSRFAARAA